MNSTETKTELPRKWKKKPIVIEAVRLTEQLALDCLNKIRKAPFGLSVSGNWHPERQELYSAYISIETLEGRIRADLGDWIIKGVKGECYPCKADIFEATYESAEGISEIDTLRTRLEAVEKDLEEQRIVNKELNKPIQDVCLAGRHGMKSYVELEDELTKAEKANGELLDACKIAYSHVSPAMQPNVYKMLEQAIENANEFKNR